MKKTVLIIFLFALAAAVLTPNYGSASVQSALAAIAAANATLAANAQPPH